MRVKLEYKFNSIKYINMSKPVKRVKKASDAKIEIAHNTRVRDYSKLKVESDIKKTESAITKLEDSIKNHEKEFENKAEQLKALKVKLEEFKFIQNNLALCNV